VQPSRPASGHGSTIQRPFTLPSVPSSCSRRPELTTRPSPDSRAPALHLTRCDRSCSQAACPLDSALALTILLGAARHRTIRLTLHSRGRPRCPTHAHFLNACGSPALHLLYSSSILAPRLVCLTKTFFPRSLEVSYNRSLNYQIIVRAPGIRLKSAVWRRSTKLLLQRHSSRNIPPAAPLRHLDQSALNP
jgi:hypothetical protein